MLSFLKQVTQLLLLLVLMNVFAVEKVNAQLIFNDLIELIIIPEEKQVIVVTINDIGTFFVEYEQVFTKGELRKKLQAFFQQNPQGLVILAANPTVIYSDVIQVLDIVREVGGDRVALATLPKTPQQYPNSPSPATGVPGYNPYEDLVPINRDGTVNQIPIPSRMIPVQTPSKLPRVQCSDGH